MKRAKHLSTNTAKKKKKRLVILLTRSCRNFQRVSQTTCKERQETIWSSERELSPASHLKKRDASVDQLPCRRGDVPGTPMRSMKPPHAPWQRAKLPKEDRPASQAPARGPAPRTQSHRPPLIAFSSAAPLCFARSGSKANGEVGYATGNSDPRTHTGAYATVDKASVTRCARTRGGPFRGPRRAGRRRGAPQGPIGRRPTPRAPKSRRERPIAKRRA